ncbi:MAG: DNA polymerase subunit beta [Desulfobacterales bacterium CG23_combo_of_CG06-09_8_20_14_all_51_8]|nr:MAG: DNA polymerase subunit beta [Desulfobacterales bacterium CG23_combo_of_CG06-09_8_20_14_all_51_8]
MLKPIDKIKNRIIECLKPIEPARVILFGSYAWGNPDKDSDIDLYVVTKDEFMPQNFSEKMRLKSAVSRRLLELKQDYGADLIVHTMPMHRKFIALNSSFARKIMSEGDVLL